ncbi:MAG: hypothetical protein HEQ31_03910 [Dolichospermum sp. OL03]|nr:hypothetical protein [Dolichospermum sp. OL01]MCO5795956.1 hypothetical protein [Dolichospermum sp. OL03]
MVVNNFHSITEVLPAIIGFSITGIFILKSIFSVKIPQYNENPPGILISSFIFIASGFLFEIIYNYWPSIQCWARNNSSITFVFTILGGFCTNRFLKKIADDKEKREISVLFRNSINLQVQSLQFIKAYLSPTLINKEHINLIKLYKNNLLTYKTYDTALNKIGIYDQKDIDRISKYSNELQLCFNYIERLLTKLDEYIKVDRSEYKHEDKLILTIVKNTILTTSLYGINIIYHLSKRYLGKLQDELFNDYKDYEEILDNFTKELSNSDNRMNEDIRSDLFNRINCITDDFRTSNMTQSQREKLQSAIETLENAFG